MTEKNLQDHLADFYGERTPPRRTAERMKALANTDLGESAPRGPRRSVMGASLWLRGYAALATLVLCVLVIDLLRPDATSERSVRGPAQPNLVAVGVFADWCSRCPTIAPVFAELADKYGNQPVLFVSLDITDDKKQRQARYLARSLGIEWLYDRSLESGMIKLVDRQRREVLATLTDSQQAPQLASALTEALPGES